MTADDVRARFEAIAQERGHKLHHDSAGYEDELTQDAWHVFHAAYRAAHADMAGEVRELVEALRLAVRQNEHDMLMTGDELRVCTAALAKFTHQEKP